VRYRVRAMWISRREVAWTAATIAVGLAVAAVALLTPWPVPAFIVGMACWIAAIAVLSGRRRGTASRDDEGLE
jgi:hypothetical protein